MKKTSNKLVSVFKEDNQVFGIITGKLTNLKEAILYPIKASHSVSRCFNQMPNGSTTVWLL